MNGMPGCIGFIGLGAMGEPMALNLLKAGHRLIVWNRSPGKTKTAEEAGAEVAEDLDALFGECRTILLMLADGEAIDAVLGRGGPDFSERVSRKTIVHTGTTLVDYSKALEADIGNAGGAYVEAPVSGSRKPAEAGQLVAMLAGEDDAVERIEPILAAMSSKTIRCGAAPNATLMKLAVNTYLISLVTGLAEAVNFARAAGLDLKVFSDILEAGPMANDVMRVKLPKMTGGDFSPQAAIRNVLDNNRLIVESAGGIGAATPILDVCETLYADLMNAERSGEDMAAVVEAITARGPSPRTLSLGEHS